MTAKKSTILIAVAMLLLEASWGQAQTEVILFKLESQAAVYNNPSQRTVFRLDQPAFITKVWTYHWNNGRGATPGRIGLRNSATGQMVGNWNVAGTYHMFSVAPGAAWPAQGDGPPYLYWTVQPNVNVPAGTYEVLDSDPSTWAYNAEMRNMGCAWVFGTYGGGGQVGPSPAATPQVQPTPPPSTTSGVYTLTAVTPDSHNAAPGKYQPFLARDGPGFGYEVLSCSSGRAEMRWWSTNSQGPGEFQVRWEWNVPSQLLPGQVWPIAGTVTVVKNHNIWPAKREEISTGSYFWPGDPASIGPQVTSDNPAGSRVTQKAVGTVSTAKADFDMNMSNAEGCMFWYHYKWNSGGASTQVVPSPQATPQVNPTFGGAPANVAGTWSSNDGSIGSLTISQSGSSVNMKYTHSNGRVIGQLRGNIFDGFWMQDTSGRFCPNRQYDSSFWGRMIITFTGDSYSGKWGFCGDTPGSGFQGNRTGGSYGQVVPSPAATPQVQPTPTAQPGMMSVRITPAQQTINSGDKAVTTADVTGGSPPYSYAWYNGTKQSQVIRGGVNWTMQGAGTRDIKVVVSDSAGGTAEAHAQIEVR